MSDHGQIATAEHVDLGTVLKDAGLTACDHPAADVDVVIGLGIALDLAFLDPSKEKIEAATRALMDHPGVGHLFSKSASKEAGMVAGTLPYCAAGIEHARAADLVCVLRSSDEPDQHGLPGKAACTTPIDVPMGGGMHGGFSRSEQNTLLAFGGGALPAIGEIDDPADLTDIVPTVLALLDLPIPKSMTGSPLAAVTGADRPVVASVTLSAGQGGFEQRLTLANGGPHPVVLQGERTR
jgi:hypothetical protein